MSKSDNWKVGTRVQHNFSNQVGRILEHRNDNQGYVWFVRFKTEDGFYEDWFKEEVLEELK